MARAAAMTLATPQGSHQALVDFPGAPDAERVRVTQAMAGSQAYLQECGFVLNFGKAGKPYALNVRFGSSVANVKVNTTDASRRHTPGTHYLWAIGSGATHSRTWFTMGLEGPWDQAVVMITGPLLDIEDALVDSILGYVGMREAITKRHENTHLRRQSIMKSVYPRSVSVPYSEYAAQRAAVAVDGERA